MNVFLKELKSHRKSLIIWCVCIVLLIAMGMTKYGAFVKTGESVEEMFEALPDAMKGIFGFGTLNITEVMGYYGIFFLYFVLMATIHAAMLGASIISKEERDKTVEFLYTKPATRNKIITSKILAAFVNVLIFNITTLISSIIIVGAYNKGESVNSDIIMLMGAMFILQLMFMFIGTGIAATTKKPKLATSISTGILLFTYMLSIAVDISDKLEKFKYITPFKYFDAKILISGEGFEAIYIVLSVVIIAVFSSMTFIFYKKRDLNV